MSVWLICHAVSHQVKCVIASITRQRLECFHEISRAATDRKSTAWEQHSQVATELRLDCSEHRPQHRQPLWPCVLRLTGADQWRKRKSITWLDWVRSKRPCMSWTWTLKSCKYSTYKSRRTLAAKLVDLGSQRWIARAESHRDNIYVFNTVQIYHRDFHFALADPLYFWPKFAFFIFAFSSRKFELENHTSTLISNNFYFTWLSSFTIL